MRLKVTFVVLNFCNTYNSGNIVCFRSSKRVYTYIGKHTWRVIVKVEGLLKVTGSHILQKW